MGRFFTAARAGRAATTTSASPAAAGSRRCSRSSRPCSPPSRRRPSPWSTPTAQISSIMFREELEDLKNEQPRPALARPRPRARGAGHRALHRPGRRGEVRPAPPNLDRPRLDRHRLHLRPGADDAGDRRSLREHGLDQRKIKFELFASGQPGRASAQGGRPRPRPRPKSAEATVTLDGATRELQHAEGRASPCSTPRSRPASTLPYACKAGVCSTCRAKVLEGEVEMDVNHALEDYEIARATS